MNERETKLAQIEQNQVDRQRLSDEAEKLQAELAELDKPKLRHGDYGYLPGGSPSPARLFVADRNDRIIHYHCCGGLNVAAWEKQKYVILGNIFDDLKRNSEDLREFSKTVRGSGLLVVRRSDFSDKPGIQFCIDYEHTATATTEEATEIHQKLGQLIATAKREAK